MAVVLGRKGGSSGGGGGGAPTGPAGGDLSGTYPNPALSVAKQAELDGKVPKSLYDANTVLAATTDDTPAAITMAASTILARLAAGNIKAATPAELRTLLALVIGTNVEAWDADLDAIAALSPSAGQIIARNATAWENQTMSWFAPTTTCIAETYPRLYGGNFSNAVGLASQTVFMQAIWLPKGVTCTSITFKSGVTALNTGVHQYFGLYDSSRNLLRATVDGTNGAWAANTLKTLNLSSTFVTTYAGLHYLAVLVQATTVPTFTGPPITLSETDGSVPILCGESSTGQTSLPNPAAAITAGTKVAWAYIS